jgi:hypothetical protein
LLRLRTGVTAFPRADGSVQVGCSERGGLRLRPPASLDQRSCLKLLSLLEAGRTAAQLRGAAEREGAEPKAAEELVAHVRIAGLLAAANEEKPARVHVHGSGPLATGLRSALEEGGALVTATCEAPLRRGITEHNPELVVLTDRFAPDPAVVHQLLVARTPHLRVRLVDGSGQIGPLVLPGRTSCLWCEQHHASDADPLWPELLRQLGSTAGRAEMQVVRAALAQAAIEIDHILRFLRSRRPVLPPRALGAIVELSHDRLLSSPRKAPAHPSCMFHTVLPHQGVPHTPDRQTAPRRDVSHRCSPVGTV